MDYAGLRKSRVDRSIPYPWLRRGIIVSTFLILVIWIVVIVFYASHDPNILCGANPQINMGTYVMLGAVIVGLGTYWASPDSKLKLKSWIRRIPMFWNSLMDSGYTPYFDPDYYEIRRGHYVRVLNNSYDADHVGLPKVNAVTPLNSFNMSIYRRYYPQVATNTKHWQAVPGDKVKSLLHKYLIERTRIVVVGQSCMIVKAWSGEHLLIHKSKYADFIADQRRTSIWLNLDQERAIQLVKQDRYVDGLNYFANKLVDPSAAISSSIDSQHPIRIYYDVLIKEMAAINNCITGIAPLVQNALASVLMNTKAPQSWENVRAKYLELRIAQLVRNVDANYIQQEILNKAPPKETDQTVEVLDDIREKTISANDYISCTTQDARLTGAHTIIGQYASGSTEPLQKSLARILPYRSDDKYPIPLKILPTYAMGDLKFHIAAYKAGHFKAHGLVSKILHSVSNLHVRRPDFKLLGPLSHINTSMPTQFAPPPSTLVHTNPLYTEEDESADTQPKPLAAMGPLVQTIRLAQSHNALNAQDIIAKTKQFTMVELAKANIVDNELQKKKAAWEAQHRALMHSIALMGTHPHLKAVKNQHDAQKVEMDKVVDELAEQKRRLEMKLQVDAGIVEGMEQLKPQMSALQNTILKRSDDLIKMEQKASSLEQVLDISKTELARATDERNALILSITKLRAEAAAYAQEATDQIESEKAALVLQHASELNQMSKQYEATTASAIKTTMMQAELKNEAQRILYTNQIQEAERRLTSISTQVNDLTNQISSNNAELSAHKEEIIRMSNELNAKTAELERITAECASKTETLARMALDLQTFEQRNKDLVNEQALLTEAIRAEGDSKLQQVERAKAAEIEAIRQETLAIQQALDQTQVKEAELAMHLKQSQENAQRMENEVRLANMLKKKLNEAKLRRIKETQDKDYQALLTAYEEANKEKSAIEVAKITLDSQVQQAQAKADALEQKRRETQTQLDEAIASNSISEVERQRAQEQIAANQLALAQQQAQVDKLVAQLNEQAQRAQAAEAALQEQSRNIKETDQNLAEQLAKAIRSESELKSQLESERQQSTVFGKLREELEAERQKTKKYDQQLKAELSKVEASHKQDIEEKNSKYKQKLKTFKKLCENTLNLLSDYQHMIRFPIYPHFRPEHVKLNAQPADLIVNVDITKELIDALNAQVLYYLGEQTLTKAQNEQIVRMAKIVYPARVAPGTFLDDVSGKVLAFVYSMYITIANHKKIQSALSSIDKCKSATELQFDILMGCRQFIGNGEDLFQNHPQNLISIATTQPNIISKFNSMIKGKDDNAALDIIFRDLNAYAFEQVPIDMPLKLPAHYKENTQTQAPRVPPRDKTNISNPHTDTNKLRSEWVDQAHDLGDEQTMVITKRIDSRNQQSDAWVDEQTINNLIEDIGA